MFENRSSVLQNISGKHLQASTRLNAYESAAGELFITKQVNFSSFPFPFLLFLCYSIKICSGKTNQSPSYRIADVSVLVYLGDWLHQRHCCRWSLLTQLSLTFWQAWLCALTAQLQKLQVLIYCKKDQNPCNSSLSTWFQNLYEKAMGSRISDKYFCSQNGRKTEWGKTVL